MKKNQVFLFNLPLKAFISINNSSSVLLLKKIKTLLLLVIFTVSSYNVFAQTSSFISDCDEFVSGPSAWPYVLIATTVAEGAASQGAQSFTMNITSLPTDGANFRVYKTTANGQDFFGSAVALTLGSNSITVGAVAFDRAVKFQFSSGDVEFDALSLNGENSECVCAIPISVTDVVEVCDIFTWIDGNTYTTSNNSATHTLINAAGCDSIITLDLTIISDIFLFAGIDLVDESTLQATALTTGIIYQWVDCNNNFSPISGETNATFTTQNSGNYAVELSMNDCSVISHCITITTTEVINALDTHYGMQVFPNPTTNELTISLEGIDVVDIVILDIQGKVLLKQSGLFDQDQINLAEYVAGTYFIKIIAQEVSKEIRITKH
jgi:hypothetical protein